MHEKTVKRFEHSHELSDVDRTSERKTLQVVILTAITMIAEIVFGVLTGSMALLADGWHMGTHAFALGISYTAYIMARRLSNSPKYSFGTGKFGVLAGYTSALFLGAIAIWMMYESVERFFKPLHIAFNEAIFVAVVGLAVNLISVWMLGSRGHHHDHDHHNEHPYDHDHPHEHDHPHDHYQSHERKHDHNFRAAYMHVIADALTSVLAIVALLSGKYLGLAFLDPVMGIVGGIMISRWAVGLIQGTARILLDSTAGDAVRGAIQSAIHSDSDSRLTDLHVWRIGSNSMAAAITVVSGMTRTPDDYRHRLEGIGELKHVTVEVNPCSDPDCACVKGR